MRRVDTPCGVAVRPARAVRSGLRAGAREPSGVKFFAPQVQRSLRCAGAGVK